MATPRPRVLCVDDDCDVVAVVEAILSDEGYDVSSLHDLGDDELLLTIGRLEPDVILLDGRAPASYGGSWELAARIRMQSRHVPVVMFTGHRADAAEAEAGSSERAARAGFTAILTKPFGLDELIETVGRAIGRFEPVDRGRGVEERVTPQLVQRSGPAVPPT